MRIILIISFLVLASCSSKKTTPAAESSAPKPKTSEEIITAVETKKSETSISLMKCSKEKDERTVDILSEGKGCKVTYTKFGAAKDMANAKNGTQYCLEVKDKIRTHLTGVGFHCE